jgi:predicted transcriptional regulator
MTTTIKVPEDLRDRIADRARSQHVSQAEVVAEALDALEQREFWSAVGAAYARLRDSPEDWAEYVHERDEWVGARLVDEQE